MSFVLAADGRDDDVAGAFRQYLDYLQASRDRFRPSAFKLATSGWYFDFRDHHCPHDAWLESFHFSETCPEKVKKERRLSLTIRLLGAYHDGYIEFHYPQVFSYALCGGNVEDGHRDWRYDELRLSDRGHLVHEIEWWGLRSTSTWLIEAFDLEFRWIEKSGGS
jgi:hypothetical protein